MRGYRVDGGAHCQIIGQQCLIVGQTFNRAFYATCR